MGADSRTMLLRVASRLPAIMLTSVLVAGPAGASAATGDGLYRTPNQAAHYLTHGLRQWSGIDLRNLTGKSAFCVGNGQQRLSRKGVPVFRTFSCVLSVTSSNGQDGTRVFQLDVAKARQGWSITSDSAS